MARSSWRHDLHRHPEIAYQEHRTSAFVAGRLSEFGYEVTRGLGGRGRRHVRRSSSTRSIALRADMDDVPIHEQTGVAHSSTVAGMMHACGHDGHTAMLLAAARRAATRKDLDGVLHVIFQPAEEVEGGAQKMIQDEAGTTRWFTAEGAPYYDFNDAVLGDGIRLWDRLIGAALAA